MKNGLNAGAAGFNEIVAEPDGGVGRAGGNVVGPKGDADDWPPNNGFGTVDGTSGFVVPCAKGEFPNVDVVPFVAEAPKGEGEDDGGFG